MTIYNDSESSKDENAISSEERVILTRAQSGPESRTLSKVFSFGCIVGLLFMACMGLAVVSFMAASITAAHNQDEWLALADGFMRAMADKEFDEAFRLFATPTQYGFKASDLASSTDGPFFAVFDGYASLEMDGWTFNFTYPEGLTVEITGPVYYHNEYEGIHQFTLIRENGIWRLLAFNVEVPQEKINAYAASQRSTAPAAYLELPPSVLVNAQVGSRTH